MTLEKSRELLEVQADFGGFYNSNAAKPILSEVARSPAAVDRLIRELGQAEIYGFAPGTRYEGGLAIKKD